MTKPSQHTVFLVEDHAFSRDGLRVAINRDPSLQVIGEARSGEESLENPFDMCLDCREANLERFGDGFVVQPISD